ncbi:MAG: CRISPR-associated endonuclease Cas3'', partial [Gaiellaceae bacterium]
ADEIAADLVSEEDAYEALIDEVRASLHAETGSWLPDREASPGRVGALQLLGEKLPGRGRALLYPSANGDGVLLLPERRPSRGRSRRVLYQEHVRAVEQRAETFARAAGFGTRVVRTVQIAARYHDAGKLDPRFQAWLNDGAPAEASDPLAKSGRAPDDPRWRSARLASGWPSGKRHELVSAALLAAAAPASLGETDRELALFLVAVHHGQARPFYDGAPDPEPANVTARIEGQSVSVRSDDEPPWAQHAARFHRLLARYGHWGLASIEAALVLADRTVSAEESE